MKIETSIPLLDEILSEWEALLGDDYAGYRNHCTRMVQCCYALKPDCTEEEKTKIIIAAAFHDIGIWIDNTVDYIPPSLPPAKAYLEATGKSDWYQQIKLMITEHHKVTNIQDEQQVLAEVFRQGDLVDFSLGTIRFGVPKETIKQLKKALPNEGFHKMLLGRGFRWILKHPLNPAPMMKW